MSLITIDGVVLPDPSSLSVSTQDLDSPDTTRNELGILQRDRIRGGMYKIELEFNVKKGSEIQEIEATLTKPKFSVTFMDTEGPITKEMYAGDKSKHMDKYIEGVPEATRWTMTFNLIEF